MHGGRKGAGRCAPAGRGRSRHAESRRGGSLGGPPREQEGDRKEGEAPAVPGLRAAVWAGRAPAIEDGLRAIGNLGAIRHAPNRPRRTGRAARQPAASTREGTRTQSAAMRHRPRRPCVAVGSRHRLREGPVGRTIRFTCEGAPRQAAAHLETLGAVTGSKNPLGAARGGRRGTSWEIIARRAVPYRVPAGAPPPKTLNYHAACIRHGRLSDTRAVCPRFVGTRARHGKAGVPAGSGTCPDTVPGMWSRYISLFFIHATYTWLTVCSIIPTHRPARENFFGK